MTEIIPDPDARRLKITLEFLVSTIIALVTFAFGVYTWWDSKRAPDVAPPPIPVVVAPPAVVAPAPAPAAKAEAPDPARVGAAPADTATKAVGTGPGLAHLLLMDGEKAAFFRNLPLLLPDEKVTRALIIIPSQSRHARECFHLATKAAQVERRERQTIILVPVFATAVGEPPNLSAPPGLEKGEPFWNAGWAVGGPSLDGSRTSSFEVIDALCAQLAVSGRFPNLRKVVMAGHGMAGTFAQHYAAVGEGISRAGGVGAEVAEEFVVISPPAYLYITPDRPTETPGRFAVPKAADCPGFDRYPFGLERPNPYVTERALKPDDVRTNLARRRTTFVLGDDLADQSVFDKMCQARLQGADRRRRAENFRAYVRSFPEWDKVCRFATLDDPGPFTDEIYETHPEVRALLFDGGGSPGS